MEAAKNKKWSVYLIKEEQVEFEKSIKKGKSSANLIRKTQNLLFADKKRRTVRFLH